MVVVEGEDRLIDGCCRLEPPNLLLSLPAPNRLEVDAGVVTASVVADDCEVVVVDTVVTGELSSSLPGRFLNLPGCLCLNPAPVGRVGLTL